MRRPRPTSRFIVLLVMLLSMPVHAILVGLVRPDCPTMLDALINTGRCSPAGERTAIILAVAVGLAALAVATIAVYLIGKRQLGDNREKSDHGGEPRP